MWSATRWEAYCIMSAQAGGKGMKESGIFTPSDLLRFPWENDDDAAPSAPISEEDRQELRALLKNSSMSGKE